MLISNKPNIRGIRKIAADVKYRTQLIGRDQRLFAGLIATRIEGMALGFVFALVLVLVPFLWVLYGLLVGVGAAIVGLIFIIAILMALFN
jgi:tetrahydromethanopterin S-methyltransferase, F subunit